MRNLCLFALLLGLGCSKPRPEPAPPVVVDAASSAAPSAAATVGLVKVDASVPVTEITSDVKSRKDPRYPGLPLFEKLYVERNDHPAEALKAKTVFDGIDAQSIRVSNRRQVLAQIVSAGFCEKADVAPDVDITVCEYDDDAAIAKGKQMMMSVPTPRREIVVWKHSTISIGRLSEDKATADAAKKIATFVKTL